MLRKLSRYFKQNAVGFLALFVALGGTAYAVNTVRSTDIVDGEVASVDIKNQDIRSADVQDQSLTTFDVSTFLGADIVDGTLTGDDLASETVRGVDIANGSLGASDIGHFNAADFLGSIGTVPAQSCVRKDVDAGTLISGDHLLLTANSSNADPNLSYSMEYRVDFQFFRFAYLKVCNPTGSAINDGTTNFNLVAIHSF